jgi:hypothetical protein
VLPVVPLLVFWGLAAWVLLTAGLDPELVVVGSQTALVPVWFLAVYIAVVALTPVTTRLWDRFGFVSVVAGVGASVLVDAVSLGLDEPWIGWLNYLFIWGTVHQLGYAWRGERLSSGLRWALAIVGLAGLGVLTQAFGYPVSMVGVPGAAVNNTLPPRLPLLALGMLQTGLLLAGETRLNRWLHGERPWTATVLVTSMIMTIYLWHLTAMVLLLAGLLAIDGFGLHVAAGSGLWWATRPAWLAAVAVITIPTVLGMARFERPRGEVAPPPAWRGISAVVLVCLGLALLAYYGVGGPDGVNWIALGLPMAGALVGRVLRVRRSTAAGG